MLLLQAFLEGSCLAANWAPGRACRHPQGNSKAHMNSILRPWAQRGRVGERQGLAVLQHSEHGRPADTGTASWALISCFKDV